jgi:hypothetical protein
LGRGLNGQQPGAVGIACGSTVGKRLEAIETPQGAKESSAIPSGLIKSATFDPATNGWAIFRGKNLKFHFLC